MRRIPYSRQDITEDDIWAVNDVLRSDFLTQGPQVLEFEKAISTYCGSRFGVAVNSATSGLHIACLALGVGPGSRVWTTANTFAASSNCALYCGARVDFVDIDPKTYNISVESLRKKLETARGEKTLPQVLVVVHFSGASAPMKEIFELSKEFDFKIIEDASHALGATYGQTRVGSNTHSDLTVFSFHPVKNITSCEGGIVVTNKEELFDKLSRLRSHGIVKEARFMKNPPQGPWYHEQIDLGFNYRLSDVHAALGISQLRRLEKSIAAKLKLKDRYHKDLKDLPLTLPQENSFSKSAWHLYVARLNLSQIKKTKKEIFETLHKKGILVQVHYIPVYLHPYYQDLGFKKGLCPEAERYYAEAISLPLYTQLTEDDQKFVIESLRDVLK